MSEWWREEEDPQTLRAALHRFADRLNALSHQLLGCSHMINGQREEIDSAYNHINALSAVIVEQREEIERLRAKPEKKVHVKKGEEGA